MNDLAKKFNVSKKTILLIVNPISKQKNDDNIKNNWRKYQDKDRHRVAINRTRKYKKRLHKEGKI